jgi:hypothetical protein
MNFFGTIGTKDSSRLISVEKKGMNQSGDIIRFYYSTNTLLPDQPSSTRQQLRLSHKRGATKRK